MCVMAAGGPAVVPSLGSWWILVMATPTVLLILGVYPALVLRKYVRIMIKLMEDNAPSPECDLRDTGRLGGKNVEFRAGDGHLLRGTILRGAGPEHPRGMIVFAHEFDSDRTSAMRYCRPLLDRGYDVFAFDFRGHGASPAEEGYKPRQWPSDRERADMVGAIAFIGDYLERQQRPRDVGLFGFSRGAGAAILASAGIDSVRAIATDSAFSSDSTWEYLMKRFATIFAKIRIVAENHPPMFWRFLRWLLFRECRRRFGCTFPSVRKAARRLRTPIFLIHGEKDSYIPIAQSQILFDAARGPKRLWRVPGAKHNQAIITQPQRYARRLVRFFDTYLAPAAAVAPAAAPVSTPVRRFEPIPARELVPVREPVVAMEPIVARLEMLEPLPSPVPVGRNGAAHVITTSSPSGH